MEPISFPVYYDTVSLGEFFGGLLSVAVMCALILLPALISAWRKSEVRRLFSAKSETFFAASILFILHIPFAHYYGYFSNVPAYKQEYDFLIPYLVAVIELSVLAFCLAYGFSLVYLVNRSTRHSGLFVLIYALVVGYLVVTSGNSLAWDLLPRQPITF